MHAQVIREVGENRILMLKVNKQKNNKNTIFDYRIHSVCSFLFL